MDGARLVVTILATVLVMGAAVACQKQEVISDEKAVENAAESFNKGVAEAPQEAEKAKESLEKAIEDATSD